MKEFITILRLKYLKAVDELCREDSLGLTIPVEVEAKMGLKPKMAKTMLKRLFDLGWLERPYRGCYRLTEKGRRILREAKG